MASRTDSLTILLDVGGVMLDQRRRSRQWPYLVGDAFAGLQGGRREAWTAAHRITTRTLERTFAHASAHGDFLSYLRSYHVAWVRGMCALVEHPIPAEQQCLTLASRAITVVSTGIRATLPGAVEAVRALHDQGYSLHTASGAFSLEITGYLQGLGVRECFGQSYGADLINAFKDGPHYYARLFADLGIRPQEALVVDDSAQALTWAAQVGANMVLLAPASMPADAIPTARITSLAELPHYLQLRREGLPRT